MLLKELDRFPDLGAVLLQVSLEIDEFFEIFLLVDGYLSGKWGFRVGLLEALLAVD